MADTAATFLFANIAGFTALTEAHGDEVAIELVSEPVDLFAVLRTGKSGTGNLPIDPVCRMAVDPERLLGQLTYEGTGYFFCSLTCAGTFAQNPARFAT